MRRIWKVLAFAFAALILVPVGAFAIVIVNEETLPQRTARYDADLREKVPPGSSKEQLRTWLAANGFIGRGVSVDPDRSAVEPPYRITLWANDPDWLSSSDMFIELQFDDRGRILTTRITSRIVSL